MILTSLVSYYERMAQQGAEISPLGYGIAKVSYGLELSEAGELLSVVPLLVEVQQGKKTASVPRSVRVPEPVVRAMGILPNFLCDNATYLLGYDAKGKPDRARACFEAAKELHTRILSSVDVPMARAIVRFFETWNPDGVESDPKVVEYLPAFAKGANLVFMMGVDMAQDDADILAAWDAYYRHKEGADEMVCLVTGERAPVARLHPKIKGVRDAQAVGASLVSFNARAFESYGREDGQGLNAPVSEYAAFAYTTALNKLLADPKHRTYLGDMTIVYWSEDGNEAASDWFAMNMGAQTNVDADEVLDDVFTKISNHRPIGEFDLETPFCVLGLAPNAARLSVRFFLRNTFGTFVERIRKHYEQLQIEKAPFEPEYLLVPALLSELSNPNAKTKRPPDVLSGAFVRSIIDGTRYPASMYATALMRVRADQDDKERRVKKISYGRAAIIKAYLLRNSSNPQIKEAELVSLDVNRTDWPYVWGRLFSVLENIQQTANPGINSTIKDRYFNAACATPRTAFPVLEKLSNAHLGQIRRRNRGAYVNLEKDKKALLDILEAKPVPVQFGAEEQGLFILGYYHQDKQRYMTKAQKEEENNG